MNHRVTRPPVMVWCARIRQVLGVTAILVSSWAVAQTQVPGASAAPAPAAADFVQDTQRWIEAAVASSEAPGGIAPLRMEVVVGALDSRLRLAPCARVEPYLPPGTRLWGRSRIGLRCLEGQTRWNVFLPVTVKAMGRAWVLHSNINAGAILSSTDAAEAEVDWAEDLSPVVLDPKQWVGSVATRSLGAGQTIRQSALRAATAFSAGSQVRVIAQGNGFAVSTDAQALNAGVVGQNVRLRMDSGRIVSGLVLDARTVRLDL